MRFLSLFSGIEAASVAWAPLGWSCVAFSEIEPFPCAVLKHHYPGVPNLGDITKITKEQIESLGHIDVVVGGFPCQDLSVAGKRKGLKDDATGATTRSGLFWDAVRIADWSKARWVLLENVPGLFSSHSGRDFACVAGALAGVPLSVPSDGWENAGAVLGPKGLVEWCVLDAQFFGVPQRRRRVFLVLDTGDWQHRPPLLLEPESLRGHPAPSRTAGESVAASLTRGADSSGKGGYAGRRREDDVNVVPILEVGKGSSSRGLGPNGSGIGEAGDPMYTLQAGAQHAIAPSLPSRSTAGGGMGTDFDCDGGLIAHPPRAQANASHRADSDTYIPEVCGALSDGAHQGGVGTGRTPTPDGSLPRVAVALTRRDSKGPDSDTKPGHLIVQGGSFDQPDVAHSLGNRYDSSEDGTGRGTPLVAFDGQNLAARGADGVADALSTGEAHGNRGMHVVTGPLTVGHHDCAGHPHRMGDASFLVPQKAEGVDLFNQALTGDQHCPLRTAGGHGAPAVMGSGVRRLTPVECSRLQGFPNSYLDIEFRGKPAVDGVKYRALGNSFAVPCITYIGRRIEAVSGMKTTA